MNQHKALRPILAAFTLSVLFGCSSMSSKQVGVRDAGGDGSNVTSNGLGSGVSFERQEQGEVYTTQVPRNQIYLFAFDNSQLARKYLPSLNAQARYLITHPGASVMLAGHTDPRGSREYNIALGERRANAVAQLMRLAGVPKRQIRVVSYGEERPVAFGTDNKSYRLNRRVELTYEAIR